MFTGIIKKTSKVKRVKSAQGGLFVDILNNLGKIKLGESISINGVCSTVKKNNKNISFEYMPETLKLTNLGLLKKGDIVNLEQSMRLSDRLDGHLVLGHIDGKGRIISIKKEGNSKEFYIKVSDKKFKKFLVYKGSIAIEGISLTVAEVLKDLFVVKILPYTLKHTNLKFKKEEDEVNLEFDILAKYASRTKSF
ncbi:MAG: riboflavin synthase [Candidatus Pacebacteria bacterium]|nr:riboflavin synthase [Candidatus Paceibacterota bacterium]